MAKDTHSIIERAGILVLMTLLLSYSATAARSSNDTAGRVKHAPLNVKDYGAKGDGVTNDGPAIQAALDVANASGGVVFLPAGTYFVDQTLLVGSHVEVFGVGKSTVLKRGNTPTSVPVYRGPNNCETNHPGKWRTLFQNLHYNCGDEGISLHDFAIDGSAVTTVFPVAVTIAFSAIKDTHINHLDIEHVPQDAIFFKNGGVQSSIRNTTIHGFGMRWGNGGGINVEMHADANDAGAPVIAHNHIIANGPNFCRGDLATPCDSDTSCATAGFSPSGCIGLHRPWFCCAGVGHGGGCTTQCGQGGSALVGIAATWVDGSYPAHVIIQDNEVEVSDRHYGIVCNGCVNSQIIGNTVRSASSSTQWSQLFTGISLSGPTHGGSSAYVTLRGNHVEGSDIPGDGRGILVADGASAGSQLVLRGNVVRHKSVAGAFAAVEVRGYQHFIIEDNAIEYVTGGPGFLVGSCTATTSEGVIRKNRIAQLAAGISPLILRHTKSVLIEENRFGGSIRKECGAE